MFLVFSIGITTLNSFCMQNDINANTKLNLGLDYFAKMSEVMLEYGIVAPYSFSLDHGCPK